MADNARGVHVSPGVYSREVELSYAVKSLGITTLGVAGETQRGPAFQPIHVEDWRQFVDNFGGTSTEKFKGSQYPKYELPYIAKSYLTESKQMEVVRVLGLSGYKAGPAWLVTAETNDGKKMVVAVLRSKGHYEKYHKFDAGKESCECPIDSYDNLVYEVGEIKRENGSCAVNGFNNMLRIKPYTPLYSAGNECEDYSIKSGATGGLGISSTNYGRFTIYGATGYHTTGDVATLESTSASTMSGYFEYPVSLNPYDKDYILKVIGSNPQDGDAPIYCESIYDVSLAQAIADLKVTQISKELTFYNVYDPSQYCGLEPISGLLTLQESALTRKNVGQRFLVDETVASEEKENGAANITVHPYDYETNLPLRIKDLFDGKDVKTDFTDIDILVNGEFKKPSEIKDASGNTEIVKAKVNSKFIGNIFTVVSYTDEQGKRNYFYRYYPQGNVIDWANKNSYSSKTASFKISSGVSAYTWSIDLIPIIDKLQTSSSDAKFKQLYCKDSSYTGNVYSTMTTIVKNLSDGLYYRLTDNNNVSYVSCDLNNYASPYRYASTPWIVSNLKGDYNNIEVNKLFRLHTISDGNSSNFEIKVSIENIRPDDGLFDVIVRDINDTDEHVIPLEKFSKCTLIPGDKNFIGYKIGSFDGIYEPKSKYITVEVAEGTAVETSVPAGFLGYPMVKYDGIQVAGSGETKIVNPLFKYNLFYDNEVKNKKQYFGLSSRVGVDIDAFTYKGKAAYINSPDALTKGFHLDSRISTENYADNKNLKVTVDGEFGYNFDAVSVNSRTTQLTDIPAIGSEALMRGSIYEYVDLRKFTVYFYGGFDGWDPYRDQRTNTDDFKMSKYLGTFDTNSGEGYAFNRIDDPDSIGLNQGGITSDWYAYLAAYRQFANPEAVDINVFATPGIDYVNNKTLVNEVIDMIEEERADSIYVVTTPDKPSGASDFVDDMYTPEDAVFNLEDSEIDSNYTCTYYPWVKYLDQDNNQYIYLPATKDVVRNFAQTDNQAYSWFAPAGLDRGRVNCVRAHYVTKLADEDTLYAGRINPIKTFSDMGPIIWGQKNLQVHESQLNRIAVRRLLLRMRKLIAIACRGLLFQPNDPTAKQNFISAVTPIMDNIRANRGISDYRIEVNDSVESRDRLELPAKIFFKPYGALEYISLDFVLTDEGVSFENV